MPELKTRAQRIAKREEMLADALARARQEVATLARSGVCVLGVHERCKYGQQMAMDCLCECHDGDAPGGLGDTEES